MAVIRDRRPPNLKLPLPEPTSVGPTSRPRFPLPLPPTTTTTASSSNIDRLSDLERLTVLGHGNGGTVYKVRHRRTHAFYALKLVHSDCDTTSRRQILREMDILRRTDSPYVVQCHGIFQKSCGDIAIVMEYMDSGTLESVLHRSGIFSENALASVSKQVLEGLSYLHSHKIVHRDIKPSNLLLNSKSEIKIADFGVSKIMCRTLDACDSYVGTCAYMSPERFDPDTYGGNYDGYAGDIWSLGLTLLELYIGHFPFLHPGQRPDWATLMCAICFGEPPSLPETASAEFRSFIKCCLQKDSSRRWTVAQLLTHPFVTRKRDLTAGFEGLSIS
ncbi:mitogen-activated protein kinase kinase 9-like [Magnolia sinica]|uniref:mitogen-activated protein kinase kinase 9-like n=1 Tax=Magnolia sinica TaxID=86752 RepID=UPI002658F1D2|nr:mitogen-activated protein kinase kinase 9-like [Magnolia sinica]